MILWPDKVTNKFGGETKFEKSKMLGRVLVYEGPFGPTLRRLKRVSIFSCGCTLVGVPLLAAYGNDDMQLVQRVAVAVAACSFAMGTTAALTWLSKPYIWRMYKIQAEKTASTMLEIESFTLFGRIRTTKLANGLNDIVPCEERIFANLATTQGDQFYVHEESDCFLDEEWYKEIVKRAQIEVPGEAKATVSPEKEN